MIKHALRNALLLIVSPILFCLVLELGARITWGIVSPPFSEKLLYGKDSVMTLFPRRITFEKSIAKRSHSKTIYITGGSTTKCISVPADKCWTSVLEKKLHAYKDKEAGFPDYQVINLGIPSGTSEDSKNALMNAIFSNQHESDGKADYLIWYEGINDIYCLIESEDAYRFQEGFTIPKITHPFGMRLINYLWQKSVLFRILLRIKDRIINTPIVFSRSDSVVYQLDREKKIELTAKLNIHNFESIKGLIRYQAFMFSIPLPKDPNERNKKKRYHFDYNAKEKFFEYLKAYCSHNDIPFGDIAPFIESEDPSDVFLEDRVHLNEYGNEIVGNLAFEFIFPYLLKDNE